MSPEQLADDRAKCKSILRPQQWAAEENRRAITFARERWLAALDEIERLQKENAALRREIAEADHAQSLAMIHAVATSQS